MGAKNFLGNIFLLIHCLSLTHGFLVPEGMKVVSTKLGEIHSTQVSLEFDGQRYVVDKFLGIPYAEPPLGNRRFKKPEPLRQFPSPLKAFNYGPICPQLNAGNVSMSEDCLTLNVMVPALHGTDVLRKPVMIWIHGGGFIGGSSGRYDPEVLAAFADVILVTMNYRLGHLGFFSTSDSESPGNYGLWDQHLAIRWVKDNIAAFGGDSDNITIFGESAGSSSVVFQTLYAGNKGLFKRAIAESGTISAWALSESGFVNNSAIKFAKTVGCTDSDSASLMRCMRQKTNSDLMNGIVKLQNMNLDLDVRPAWIPVFDNDFVIEDPAHMLENARNGSPLYSFFHEVDLMIGWNNCDGCLYFPIWMYQFNSTSTKDLKVTEDQLNDFYAPRMAEISLKQHPSAASTSKVRKQYLADINQYSPNDRIQKVADMSTDAVLAAPTVRTADAHSSKMASTFVYTLTANPPYRILPLPAYLDRDGIANHGDDLMFVFGLTKIEPFLNDLPTLPQPNSQQIRLSKAMMTMWSNFARSGDPNKPRSVTQIFNIDWQRYDRERPKYLEISANMTSASLKDGPSYPAINFWNNVLPKVQEAN